MFLDTTPSKLLGKLLPVLNPGYFAIGRPGIDV